MIVNATPGERATPHRGSHPAPPIMKRGETSQLHLLLFRCVGRIPRSILMQLPPTLKVLLVQTQRSAGTCSSTFTLPSFFYKMTLGNWNDHRYLEIPSIEADFPALFF